MFPSWLSSLSLSDYNIMAANLRPFAGKIGASLQIHYKRRKIIMTMSLLVGVILGLRTGLKDETSEDTGC
jgi:hypothetical protein